MNLAPSWTYRLAADMVNVLNTVSSNGTKSNKTTNEGYTKRRKTVDEIRTTNGATALVLSFELKIVANARRSKRVKLYHRTQVV